MIPVIDVSPLQDGNRFRGIGTYVRGLLTGLEQTGTPVRRVGLPWPPAAEVGADRAMGVRRGLMRRTAHRILALGDGEFAHLTSLAAADTRVRGPYIATVHDPIPLLFPEWHFTGRGGLRRRRRFDHYLTRLRGATRIVAVSRATAREFARILDRPLEDFTITPLAPAELPEPSAWRWRDGAPYVFVAGNHEPHKNVVFAVEVAAAIPAPYRPPLITAGVRDDGPWRVIQERARGLDVELVHLGHVDEQRLADLYAGAKGVLVPSMFEGFGLPTLEAMACGTPVVVSDRGALPEVAGGVGTVLPLEIDRWVESVQHLLDGGGHDPRRLREHAAAFTWRRTAEATLDAYRAVDARSG